MEKVTLSIEGMSCMGCVRNISDKLQKMAGVGQVNVSLSDKNAVIEFDPQQTNVAHLTQCVTEAGFDVL